ncbi:MAG TPA: F0F1 ATP synthase subunit A [Bacteroidota bacterium]|nr:F0F1 ATP synthase subunit A [Bacteroidota bacterium]
MILAQHTEALHAGADSLHQGVDTLARHAAEGGAHEGNLFTELLHHTQDAHELHLPLLGAIELPHLHIGGIDVSITKHVVFLLLSAVVLILALGYAARQNKKRKVPTGFGNLIEIFIVFIRDEIVVPNMGKGGLRYLPYLLTTFFFILTMNLFGLIPYGASATGNVNVTAGLAVIAFIMIQVAAIRAQGIGHYIAHLTGGVHWALWPIMIPIEVLGLFTKPFALCIRLFANMTGGHIVIVALIGLIFVFKTIWVAPVSVGFVLAINFLELFVAFLQAYIFTMLTSLFMGLGMTTEHAEHAAAEHPAH